MNLNEIIVINHKKMSGSDIIVNLRLINKLESDYEGFRFKIVDGLQDWIEVPPKQNPTNHTKSVIFQGLQQGKVYHIIAQYKKDDRWTDCGEVYTTCYTTEKLNDKIIEVEYEYNSGDKS